MNYRSNLVRTFVIAFILFYFITFCTVVLLFFLCQVIMKCLSTCALSHSSVRLATDLAKLSLHVSRLNRVELCHQYIREQIVSRNNFTLKIITF